MNKTFKLYGIIFIVVLAVLTILEFSKNEVTDWRKNFDTNKKSPFGLFVFDKESKTLLGDTVQKTGKSPYDYYKDLKKTKPHNILLIQKEPDEESVKKLLAEVSKGSDMMIVNESLYGSIADTLKLSGIENINFEDVNTLNLTDTKFKQDSLYVDKMPGRSGYKWIPKNSEILGTVNSKDGQGANFIKIKFGKGNIYIHTEPIFITNYYFLKPGNEKYTQDVFSYLPKRPTVWFTDDSNVFESRSPMRFILSNPALKYSWWLFLLGLLLFAFFNAKRKQRMVPIVEPLKNKSVEFVKSIGNLYLQEGDFHDMMSKKAQYFLHKVRLDFMIDTKNLDEEFAKKLHLKTGKNIDKIKEAIMLMRKGMDPYSNVMREDLIRMNTLLDEILK